PLNMKTDFGPGCQPQVRGSERDDSGSRRHWHRARPRTDRSDQEVVDGPRVRQAGVLEPRVPPGPSVGVWVETAGCFRRTDGLLSGNAVLDDDTHNCRTRSGPQALAQGPHPGPRSYCLRCTLIALPLSLKGMDGAPARIIGIENLAIERSQDTLRIL